MIHADNPATRLAGGTVAGTFGTAQTITLGADARRVIGFSSVGVDATYTTLEGSSQIMRINSSDLGLSNQDFLTGPIVGSGPGTNSFGQPGQVEILPFDAKAGGNENIALAFAPAGLSTVAKLFEASVIYADQEGAPMDWKQRYPFTVAFGGGQVSRTTVTATTRTNVGNVTIPAWAREIVGFKGMVVKSGALTTLEETLGFWEIATTIKGTDPQNWPSNTGFGAPLGTPVGSGQWLNMVPYTPLYIPMTGRNETVSPFFNLRTTSTAAVQLAFAIAYR